MNRDEINKAYEPVFTLSMYALYAALGGLVFLSVGTLTRELGGIFLGALALLFAFAVMWMRRYEPIETALFVAISKADWCDDAKAKLAQAVQERGDKLTLRDLFALEKIQDAYEIRRSNEVDTSARKKALRSLLCGSQPE